MALDSSDFQLIKSLRDAVREGDAATANLLRKMIEKNMETQTQNAQAFNRIATALESLAKEVKGLREDLAPQLEKPKLPPPGKSPKAH